MSQIQTYNESLKARMQLLPDKSHYNSSRAVSNIRFVIGAKQWVKQTIRIRLNSEA